MLAFPFDCIASRINPAPIIAAFSPSSIFESDIVVAIEDKIIYSSHISAEKFRGFESSDFWNNATLEHVWVNQEQSNTTTLSLGVSIINPKNK